jgi:hypothetical protein
MLVTPLESPPKHHLPDSPTLSLQQETEDFYDIPPRDEADFRNMADSSNQSNAEVPLCISDHSNRRAEQYFTSQADYSKLDSQREYIRRELVKFFDARNVLEDHGAYPTEWVNSPSRLWHSS